MPHCSGRAASVVIRYLSFVICSAHVSGAAPVRRERLLLSPPVSTRRRCHIQSCAHGRWFQRSRSTDTAFSFPSLADLPFICISRTHKVVSHMILSFKRIVKPILKIYSYFFLKSTYHLMQHVLLALPHRILSAFTGGGTLQ